MNDEAVRLVNRQFGLRVEQLRTTLGLTQQEVSKRVRLQRSSVANIERGKQGNVSLDTVERFAEAFGTSPKHLMKGIWT